MRYGVRDSGMYLLHVKRRCACSIPRSVAYQVSLTTVRSASVYVSWCSGTMSAKKLGSRGARRANSHRNVTYFSLKNNLIRMETTPVSAHRSFDGASLGCWGRAGQGSTGKHSTNRNTTCILATSDSWVRLTCTPTREPKCRYRLSFSSTNVFP